MHRGAGDAGRGGELVVGQAAEDVELEELGFAGVEALEVLERGVDGQ